MKPVLLIPVKDLSNAKHRLTPLLSREERRQLAWLMLTGVLEAAAALPRALRKVIVTNHTPAKELGGRMGYEVLWETRQVSESNSVDRASGELERDGAEGVLRLPLDLPLIEAEDLERILALADEGMDAVLVPSLDGTGTNALYRSPPTLFPSRFGPGSLALHEQRARERGAAYAVERRPSLALDIDDAGDVAALLRANPACPAGEYLAEIGVGARLEERGLAAGAAAEGLNSDS